MTPNAHLRKRFPDARQQQRFLRMWADGEPLAAISKRFGIKSPSVIKKLATGTPRGEKLLARAGAWTTTTPHRGASTLIASLFPKRGTAMVGRDRGDVLIGVAPDTGRISVAPEGLLMRALRHELNRTDLPGAIVIMDAAGTVLRTLDPRTRKPISPERSVPAPRPGRPPTRREDEQAHPSTKDETHG